MTNNVHNRIGEGLSAAAGRPVVLLDIDGVCSPMCPVDELDAAWAPWRRVSCGWNRGWVSAGLADALVALGEHADVWWCTGWESEALFYGTELGVPTWPYLPLLNVPDQGMFKLASVIASVGDRPVWWFDDEHNDASDQWATDRTSAGIATVAAHIDDQRGLRADDLAAVGRWARTITTDAGA
ncbi:hypothetical protein [Prescottella agglutinans]|uniref:Secreted protein n=1 Tax=Prescottella agglutinans TaxID=1644129 RepID=A0ABT6MI03_9NOCA|nr:hypothetical protein [Prescottella agglutinans]MDH6283966.1 hypothetical protein [Prescottella agglutinans]